MPYRFPLLVAVCLFVIGVPGRSVGQVTTFSSQALFQAELTGSFTLINLDVPPMDAFSTPYDVTDVSPAAALAGLGVVSVNPAAVGSGQAFQISEPGRDRLIINGTGSSAGGNLVIDLVQPVDGFGARSNLGDGGRVRAFSGPGLSGFLIGEANISSGGFGGITSGTPIRSVEVTCDFNADLICGVYDLQHGRLPSPVPIDPRASVVLLMAALGVGRAALGRGERA